ncbi:MAG: prolyl oligopeptidase family serine peptidase [Clostridia bacterium]|nr:prolyl oligopeptidase family serine peptidase [Clostridia bacterium]
MEKRIFEELDYVLRMPAEFSNKEKYPLVIYLHGAGGRGRDTDVIYNHPFFSKTEPWLKGAISVAPQCYEDSWFSIFEQLQAFVKAIVAWDSVDKSRVYVVGASMGGYATWQLAMSRPELFAAIIPICGGGMYWNAGRLIHMGVWAFHGEEDITVFPQESKKMVDAVNVNGGNAKLTIYERTSHDAWTKTFENKDVWEWLLSHKSKYRETKSAYDNVRDFG